MLFLGCLTYVFLIFFLKLDQPESIIQGVGDKEVDDKGQKPFPKIQSGVTEDTFTKSRRTYSEYNDKLESGSVLFGAEYEAFKQSSYEKFATLIKR